MVTFLHAISAFFHQQFASWFLHKFCGNPLFRTITENLSHYHFPSLPFDLRFFFRIFVVGVEKIDVEEVLGLIRLHFSLAFSLVFPPAFSLAFESATLEQNGWPETILVLFPSPAQRSPG